MARPKPNVILSRALPGSDFDMDVCEATGYWIVTYKTLPFTGRRRHRYQDQFKYYRTGFTAPGHAEALARRLNQLFDTTDFATKRLW